MFLPLELSTDTLPNKLILQQPLLGFRSGSDALLLVQYFLQHHAFISKNTLKKNAILDMGCGSGAVSLSVLKDCPSSIVTGLDIQADYCDLAKHNAHLNNLDSRFTAIQGDIQEIHTVFKINSFDYVLTNPPFYNITSGRLPDDVGKQIAHHGTIDLITWIRKALYPLRNKGYLMMICRTDRLGDIYTALHNRAGNIHIYPIVTGKNNYAKRIVLWCQKATKGGTQIHHQPYFLNA